MDAVEQVLYALADANNGRLTPAIVVAAATDPESPLHNRFTWDDTEAAIKHRENEARALIRTVRVEFRTETFSFTAPAFIREPGLGRTPGYISTGRLKTDEDAAREAVIQEFTRASAALKRAQEVAAALDMSDEIKVLQDQITLLVERASQGEASASN